MMINSLYQLSNKGSLRTLSFILALFLTAAFFTAVFLGAAFFTAAFFAVAMFVEFNG